jgi:hypothetical protein
MSYPNVNNPSFYEFVNKKYRRYHISREHKTLKEICFPKKYQYQVPQKFLPEFINPDTPYLGVLIFHRIGAGKTCTAISIAENFKKTKTILVVLPASLKGNFRNELRSSCGGNDYLTQAQRLELKSLHPSDPNYTDILKTSDAKIDKYYTIISYNKFATLVKDNDLNLRNTVLIIDEIHNMISETGIYYELLYDMIKRAPLSLRIILMSATPIFDKPVEIGLTMNLLPLKTPIPTGSEFYNTFIESTYTSRGFVYETKNMDLFKQMIRGYVSYYRGAPPYVFPAMELFTVRCKMSDLQLKVYNTVAKTEHTDMGNYLAEDISNSFLIGTRMISNVVFPNEKINFEGFNSFNDDDLSMAKLRTYSPKFYKILRKIKKAEGTVFVYSNFKQYGGIKTFVKILEHHGFKNYEFNNAGKKRFAIWSGDQTAGYKEEVKAVYNNINNVDGSQIKIILGSPSIKEGVSLLRVQEVHILEPYWNMSRLDQVIGRAIRFCSHKDLPKDKRKVSVYIYLAVHPSLSETVDQRIWFMALQKQKIIREFEMALKESAIDCELFKNANQYRGEEDIVCVK